MRRPIFGSREIDRRTGLAMMLWRSSLKRIPTLDGWRGIAILLVLIDHASLALRRNGAETIGLHGVTIFFVLSGFLITTTLLREKEATGRIDLKRFYIRRFFRLMPCAWSFLLFALVITIQFPQPSIGITNIVAVLLFFRNYAQLFVPQSNLTAHFWSLSIEEQFYLVWPSLLISLGIRRAGWFAAAGAIAVAIYRLTHWSSIAFPWGTHVRADALLVGCALALSLPTLRKWLRSWMAIPLLAGLVLCMMRYHSLIPLHESIIIALLLAVTSSSDSPLSRFLDWKPVVFLGTISYGLYVWQHPYALAVFVGSMHPLTAVLQLFGIVLISRYFLEVPLIRLAHRLTPIQTTEPTAVPR